MKIPTLLFFLFLITVAWSQKEKNNYPLVSFAELSKAPADTVRLKAFVLDVYICPPCPPGMICKPCIENHVTVVEDKPIDIMKIPSNKRIRIFTDNPKGLNFGERYLFTVKFRNKNKSPMDNLELIAYRQQ